MLVKKAQLQVEGKKGDDGRVRSMLTSLLLPLPRQIAPLTEPGLSYGKLQDLM
jgi:hypothetical protein